MIENIENIENIEKKLYHYAVRLLGRGEQTVFQLTIKLKQRLQKINNNNNINNNYINNIIEKLTHLDWLSDSKFAHAFARTKINQKIGPVKILYELTQKGLKEQDIHTYLESCEVWQENNWVEQARQVLIKKYANTPVIWAKKAHYLQSRGYTLEQIKEALTLALSREAEEGISVE